MALFDADLAPHIIHLVYVEDGCCCRPLVVIDLARIVPRIHWPLSMPLCETSHPPSRPANTLDPGRQPTLSTFRLCLVQCGGTDVESESTLPQDTSRGKTPMPACPARSRMREHARHCAWSLRFRYEGLISHSRRCKQIIGSRTKPARGTPRLRGKRAGPD